MMTAADRKWAIALAVAVVATTAAALAIVALSQGKPDYLSMRESEGLDIEVGKSAFHLCFSRLVPSGANDHMALVVINSENFHQCFNNVYGNLYPMEEFASRRRR